MKKSFWALLATQFCGAFNDNLYKILVSLLVVAWVSDPKTSNQWVAIGTGVFAAPFLLFSMFSGRVADRYSKSRVIVATKMWEIAVIAAAILSLSLKNIPLMMLSLFMLSLQATFFSPVKYGVLPELVSPAGLSGANAWLNIATFAAILAGTLAGGFVTKNWMAAGLVMMGMSVLGLLSSLLIERLPAIKPDTPLLWNPFTDLAANWRVIRQDRSLKLAILAVNYFWFMGAALQTNIFLYTSQMMRATDQMSTYLIVAIGVGIGCGSYLAGKLSAGKVELGLVPLGALGMTIFSCDLLWAYHTPWRVTADFFLLGASAGLFDIPLVTLIQWRSPETERGRVLATSNFLSFVAIGIASLVLWVLGTGVGLNPAQVFFAMGVLSLIGTVVIVTFLPDSLLRLFICTLTNFFYRIRVDGREHVPATGPALLVSNHLSLVDGFLVGTAVPRLVRFLMWRPYYEAKPWHGLLRIMKAIPISDQDPPKEILRSLLVARKALEEGHLVCIFAEGQISRTGNLLEFKKGFEVIVKSLNVPVIPVHLDRVWGSIFSFEHGRAIFKKPRRIPYPVTVTFGAPVRESITATSVRQAVLDLGTTSFRHRLEERGSLALEFVKTARRQPRVLAVADSSKHEWSFGLLASLSLVLARRLKKDLAIQPEEAVGLLLPPCGPGVAANIAVSLLGASAVNLNYTAGATVMMQAAQKARLRLVVTSRKLLEKTGLPASSQMVYIEDYLTHLPKWQVVLERVWVSCWPERALLRRYTLHPGAMDLSKTATIMFSSGSTGVPKGIVLTHANVLSNILGLAQVFDIGPHDRMVGVLPLFHSFGYTASMWFPLIHGFGVLYHARPLETQTIGDLAKHYGGSILLATPTFLAAYTRKCTPDQFHKLRLVITGAERLRETIANDFEAKFKVRPLEGYGCTELSPVACANVPNVSMGEIHQVGWKPGTIGHPIPGVSVKIVDPDTLALKPQGEPGLLLVKGPNVMKQYLGEPQKTSEVIQDGWYLTGDIAVIDPDGFVRLVDRLSRFSKIGGEMVPHVLVEEKLHHVANAPEAQFAVTGAPDEKRGERLVVFYTALPDPLTIEDVLHRLQATDLAKLWIPSREHCYSLEAIPQLGTGKTDLARLKALAHEAQSKQI